MEKKKLLKLADFLETKIPKRGWKNWFNLTEWAQAGWVEKECGTTACAMGWATICFPRSDLRLTIHELSYGKVVELQYKGYMGFCAAAKFFNIGENQAEFLFSEWAYLNEAGASPTVVAKRIREFVKGHSRTKI